MGAKKKTTANRLAKMSDEERARYMQHKADIEEEARRRKEQLIATFMKNKIKKEDAFARLNIAKINQQWHQILRKSKCKEMKENLEHMKQWIERTLHLKDKTIQKLMTELEQAEEQYSHNFQAHMSHVHNIIESHQDYIDKLQYEYDEDREDMLENAKKERNCFLQKSENDFKYLEMVRFGQGADTEKHLKLSYELYIKKYDDVISTYRLELDTMIASREGICIAIWRQIAAVLRAYVQQTDTRRMHLAELRRLDAESATEIVNNQDTINREEEQVELLKTKLIRIKSKSESTKRKLNKNVVTLTEKFRTTRKQLHHEINQDEKKLKLVTDTSNNAIEYLKIVSEKAKQILQLMEICRKFETEQEKVIKWETVCEDAFPDSDTETNKTDAEKIAAKNQADLKKHIASVLTVKTHPKKGDFRIRPKTSKPGPAISLKQFEALEEKSKEMFKRQCKVHERKLSPQDSTIQMLQKGFSPTFEDKDVKSSKLNENIEALYNLENFWHVYSKVKLNCMELAKEKSILIDENNRLKEIMRNVLESLALEGDEQSLRMISKARSVASAPPKYVKRKSVY